MSPLPVYSTNPENLFNYPVTKIEKFCFLPCCNSQFNMPNKKLRKRKYCVHNYLYQLQRIPLTEISKSPS
jgi:hypothetical protein